MSDLFNYDWANEVVDAVIDNTQSNVMEPSNVMQAVEKSLMSNMGADFERTLRNSIKKLINPAQEEKKTKILDLDVKIKDAIIASNSEGGKGKDEEDIIDDILSSEA